MSEVIVDADLRARLNGLREQLAFRDEHGNVIGHFVPVEEDEELFVPPPEDKCPYTPEELDRARKQTGGRPLKELWKELGVE